MYVIVKIAGKQYKVVQGDIIDVDLLGLELGAFVAFSEVLFCFNGNDHLIGIPGVAGMTVEAKVVGSSSGPKIESAKCKPRKRQNRRFGHRQHYSRIEITNIAVAA